MIDTCQAESLFQKFYSPNILAVASSKVGEDSLSVITILDLIVTHARISTHWVFFGMFTLYESLFVCLILYVPVNSFSVMMGGVFLG